ncbi:hypothetical protein F2Q69_00037748 [Brassica cretica]|uniref:Uncharacterized protein n=1 Tax=Brassica cretica TaxID=69181 RepID=A0A8S9SFQ8_BRACR|nr:hypothetical protein F2Q69_00037748 [Brassica cretica]
MDPDSEVKKRERLTKCILKLKNNQLTGVRIESSGSRKPRMLQKSLSLCGPRVEIIGTRDWKTGVLAKNLLNDQKLLGDQTKCLINWTSGNAETLVFQDVTVYHHVFCPDVGGETKSCKDMYLPRHNCTVIGTQGVQYCGFPIAMKAWMRTSESLPSHDCRTKVCHFGNCEPGRTESPKGKLCKGSSVGSGHAKETLDCENQPVKSGWTETSWDWVREGLRLGHE